MRQGLRSGLLMVLLITITAGCTEKGSTAPPPLSPSPTGSPTPPASEPPALTVIRVGVAGNTEPVFQPGQNRQFWALGTYADGSEGDLTNRVLWQTSNPIVATVSAAGVVAADGYGGATITATRDGKQGSLGISVAPQSGCRVTLSPDRLTFGPFANSATVQVTAVPSDCRWTVSSDASWLPFRFDPGRSGSGGFSYSVPGNSTPAARTARLIVSAAGATSAVHTIDQERPRSCSYVVRPERTTLTRAGGNATFQVDSTPNDCRWTAAIPSYYGSIVSGQSGTGDGTVVFNVRSVNYEITDTVEIRGLSGENPPGIHTFRIQ